MGSAIMNLIGVVFLLIYPRSIVSKDPVVKTYHDRTVYVLKDGMKHSIPDWGTFVALGYDVSNIKTLEDADLAAIPEGEPASAIVEAPKIENPLRGCPCVSEDVYEQSLKTYLHKTHMFCFIENQQSTEFFKLFDHKMLSIQHKMLPITALDAYTNKEVLTATPEMKDCDIVINLLEGDIHGVQNSTKTFDKYVCPEMCVPVPYTELPLSWLLLATSPPPEKEEDLKLISTRALTCSLTYRELWQDLEVAQHHHNGKSAVDHQHQHISMGLVLRMMVKRRFEECNEHHLWQPGANIATPRKVFGFIIWVGSRSRYGLLRSQIEILQSQSSDPDTRIMGWLASEDQYACKVGSTLCYEVSNSNAYFPAMPSTRLNVASAGWACAQRRQLRALQHTLLLFDPQFMIIADDDTYVNIVKLAPNEALDRYIRNELVRSNHVVGSLTLGKKITNKGFYWGGAGYMFGRPVIEALNARQLHGPEAASDGMRDEYKTRTLHLLKETYDKSRKICHSCTAFDTPPKVSEDSIDIVGVTANVTVRVVEVCTNLMSQEHTCFHSDHAMSRCLLYGANGFPVHSDCGGSRIGAEGVIIGMCMGTDTCSANQLTCHRFYPNPTNPFIAKGQYI